MSLMHEVQNPFDVYVRKLGHSLVRFIIPGSTSSNPQYLVRVYNSGIHRVVDMVDLVEYGNPSAGEALVPNIPEDWLTPSDLEKKYTKVETHPKRRRGDIL